MAKRDSYLHEQMTIDEQNAAARAFLSSESQKNGRAKTKKAESQPEPWEDPVPLGSIPDPPPLPVDSVFPDWMSLFIKALSEATQTPPDLASMLTLAQGGAALSGKFRVQIRDGWPEPTNLYAVTALLSGERKSAVFKETMAPTYEFEAARRAEMASIIAGKQAEHVMLEARKNHLAAKAAKEDDPAARMELLQEAKKAAAELAKHFVPPEPELVCDDVTPEHLGLLLVKQGGKILQAGPEGTAFEIAKGRYSEQSNFDVYLKGHSGDPWRSGRVSREREACDSPALSVALAVQPDVIHGLAADATLKTRGFLARFLYSIPASLVGRRKIAPHAVPEHIAEEFRNNMLAMWKTFASADETGKEVPNWLHFSAEADGAMRQFETWLEPLLAPGEELSLLAGWANKLAGEIARIAGILHVAHAIGEGQRWNIPISRETVEAAILLGRDYLLPHAKIAFGLMGADPRVADAQRVLDWLARSVDLVNCVSGGRVISKRDIHARILGSKYSTEEVGEVVNLLVQHGYLRLHVDPDKNGPGRKPSTRYEIHPHVFSATEGHPRSHNTRNPRNREPGEEG